MLDPAIFAESRRQINNVATCDGLQDALVGLAGLRDVESSITAQIAQLQPVLALLTPPGANPVQIVTWLTDFIDAVLKPYVRPIEIYVAQGAQVVAEIGSLATAIEQRAGAIGNCTVDLTP